MKSRIVRNIQLLFKNPLMEKLLIGIILTFPSLRFTRKFAPQNREYGKEEIRSCTRNGINYCLDIRDYQSWLIYFDCDQDSSSEVLKWVKKGQTIIDVGGNIGQTAMMMAKMTGETGRVICFEPHPRTFAWLQKNVSLNPRISNLRIEHMGLGKKEEQLPMFVECETNSGGNRIANDSEKNSNAVQVRITTLDQYFSEHKVGRADLVKIDVEGFEMNVLRGMNRILEKDRPLLYLEIDDSNLRKQGDSAQGMIDFLRGYDYEVMDVLHYKVVKDYRDIPAFCRDIFCRPK